ncbi:hypothetical protein GCM10018954_089040 [Kutzneria kofuensis]
MRRTQGAAYLFLSPWIIGATLLTVGPMLASLYLSLTDYDLFDPPKWIGLDNYRVMSPRTTGSGRRSAPPSGTCCSPCRSSSFSRWPSRCC